MIISLSGLGCPDCFEEGLAGILEGLGACPTGMVANGSNCVLPEQLIETAAAESLIASLPTTVNAPIPVAALTNSNFTAVAPSAGIVNEAPLAASPAVIAAASSINVPSPAQTWGGGKQNRRRGAILAPVNPINLQESVPVAPAPVTSGIVSTTPAITSGSTTDNPILDWLGLSDTPIDLISGVPNWVLIGAGLGAWALFGGGKK